MASDTVLTPADKDNFVSDLVDYGTDFAAPLYAVVESIEQAVLQSAEVQRLREDAGRWQAFRGAIVTKGTDFLDRLETNLENAIDNNDGTPTEDQIDAAIDAAMEKQP